VLWWSFFTAATGWAWSFVSLTATRSLFGMGEAGCFPNLTKTFTTWLPEKERVRAQGIMWLPSYLRQGRHMEIASTALLSVLPLLFGGLGNPAGVVVGGWLLRGTGDVAKTRRIMAYLGFAGASGFPAFSTVVHNPLLAMLPVGMASFSNDLVMPGAWAAVMDIGGKYAGSLAGASYAGGILTR
jgi:hypothetical protein